VGQFQDDFYRWHRGLGHTPIPIRWRG
jgi:hypothetical protein